VERVPTGIEGLDKLVQGGIPKGASVLLSGSAGTGKTILALQYLYNGAVKYNEAGVYITFEGSPKTIAWDMESFGWDFKKLQDKSLLKIYRLNLTATSPALAEQQIEAELRIISRMVKELNAKRLVVDSTTAFAARLGGEAAVRNILYNFCDSLKQLECTSLLTTETGSGRTDFSAFGVEEFVSDGIIAMYFTPPNRSIHVRKMRGTSHSKKVHPFEITEKGITIKDKDEVLWEALGK